MLAPISNGRRDKGSSFTKLKNYLTKEKDPETGDEIDRGEVVLSDNLLSLETADLEMTGIAGENRRNTDAYRDQLASRSIDPKSPSRKVGAPEPVGEGYTLSECCRSLSFSISRSQIMD